MLLPRTPPASLTTHVVHTYCCMIVVLEVISPYLHQDTAHEVDAGLPCELCMQVPRVDSAASIWHSTHTHSTPIHRNPIHRSALCTRGTDLHTPPPFFCHSPIHNKPTHPYRCAVNINHPASVHHPFSNPYCWTTDQNTEQDAPTALLHRQPEHVCIQQHTLTVTTPIPQGTRLVTCNPINFFLSAFS